MDNILDILLKKNEIKKISLKEILVSWGSGTYSQSPRKYRWGKSLVFHESSDMNYYNEIVGNELDLSNYLVLTLEGEVLSNMEISINMGDFTEKDNEITLLFFEMYDKLSAFSIIKLVDDEQINNKYILNNFYEALKIFINSMIWENPNSIMISKK